jgi:hypothetical protein
VVQLAPSPASTITRSPPTAAVTRQDGKSLIIDISRIMVGVVCTHCTYRSGTKLHARQWQRQKVDGVMCTVFEQNR